MSGSFTKITSADSGVVFPITVALADSLSSNLPIGSQIASCATFVESPIWSLGPDDASFAIDDSGIVTNTVSPIPREATNLTITVTSVDSETGSLTVSLPIVQLPDFQGLVLRPDSIADNAPIGTVVGKLTANISGVDSSDITFTLIEPSDPGLILEGDQVVLEEQLVRDDYTLTIEAASPQAHVSASFSITVHVVAVQPPSAGDVFYQKLKEGIIIICTSDRSLNATYAIDQGRVDTIGGVAHDATSGFGFPSDLPYFDYADIDGVSHRFDETHIVSFYKATRDLMHGLVTQAQIMADGGTPVWPSNEVTIP